MLDVYKRQVYEDKNFQDKLKDAATSMKVGSVWNPGNVVGPMITNKNCLLYTSYLTENEYLYIKFREHGNRGTYRTHTQTEAS